MAATGAPWAFTTLPTNCPPAPNATSEAIAAIDIGNVNVSTIKISLVSPQLVLTGPTNSTPINVDLSLSTIKEAYSSTNLTCTPVINKSKKTAKAYLIGKVLLKSGQANGEYIGSADIILTVN